MKQTVAEMGLPDESTLKGLADLMELFYGDALILKIWWLQNASDCVFVARLSAHYLRDSIRDITFKFGPTPEEPWTLLGQVARITEPNEGEPSRQAAVVTNDFENAIEKLFDGVRQISAVGGVTFPHVSLTPLGIYRGR